MTDNKLGMFIHWGLYAATGLHEQAFARYDLPREEYEGLSKTFDPADYDPAAWVKLAKDAGMEYICLTAKHHDGFCLWDTKETEYKITNTPYGKDVLGMLAEACAKEGLRFSVYYSNPDWHHPDAYNPLSTHQWKARRPADGDLERYKDFVRRQITELLTQYGPIYTLFWDIEPHVEDPSLNALARRLQPGILINDRGWDRGDFSTPERELMTLPNANRFPGRTEACNSVGAQSWGYRAAEDFYSLQYLLSAIDRVMAMGGSYLLNVGPDARGVIPEEYASRIRAVGEWYRRMGGCLTGHEDEPCDYCVQRDPCVVNRKGGKTYFHFYDGLISNAVILKNAPCLPKSVHLVNTGESLPFAMDVLPDAFDFAAAKPGAPKLHIRSIPVDALPAEPIVLEVEF